jgi:two-component system, chemotaxis family, protein-glutamate methylesterase/glutaminase
MTAVAAGPRHDIIVLGGSAGAIEALLRLVTHLPDNLPAAVMVAVHMSSSFPSRLAELLALKSSLPVEPARHGTAITPGRVYVAVPDLHLSVDSGTLELTRGPKEHFTRPAIDVLFRSAARAYGPRVAGILLSGGGSDGTFGLVHIKASGGITIVEDPEYAQHRSMLLSAIRSQSIDYILPLPEIGKALPRLATGESLDDAFAPRRPGERDTHR